MSYEYQNEKFELFTDDGQRMFLAIRDKVHRLLKDAGCFRMQEAMNAAGGGSSWTMLACVDRLVELGEIREVIQNNVAGQRRIFTYK